MPDAMVPGPTAIDPCLGRDTVPIAVAGNRSPDGRAWAVLQHGSVGTSDDVAETWSWHCKVLTVGNDLIRPRGIVSWGHDDALVWGVTPRDEPVALVTGDGGATWAAKTPSNLLGATTADLAEVLAWAAAGTHLARLSTASGEWTSVNAAGLPGTPTEVALVDGRHGWAYGRASGDAGQTWLTSTDDGGETWSPVPVPSGALEGIAPSTDRAGCVLLSNSVHCTSDLGATWRAYRVDVRVDHIAGLPPPETGASEWYRWTAVAAGDGGGVRFFSDSTYASGTTIDYTSGNPIRFLQSSWGRYVTTNSWDGCIELMDRSNDKNHAYALGMPAPDDPDHNPC